MNTTSVNVVLFGEFSLSYKENVLAEKDYRSQKMWAVLAYLILNRKRPVTQAELIDQFWDDEDGQNPSNALKTLIFRLRKMLVPLLGAESQPVISDLGSYQWNPQILCEVDVDRFEALLHRCQSKELSLEDKMESYRQALALYRGDFLPKAINLSWHTMRSAYYHMQYSQAACDFARLLEAQGKNEELTRVCHQTLHQGVLEEQLYVLLIRGLLHMGNHTQALQQYEKATEVLYHELGVARSSPLRGLYREIMNEGMKKEGDISAIVEDLKDDRGAGAFFCEYSFFKEACRMEARRSLRRASDAYIALLTLSPAKGRTLSKEVQRHTMDILQKILQENLRQGDVVAQYSAMQYVLLFCDVDHEDSLRICRRIEEAFSRSRRHTISELHCSVHSLKESAKKGGVL